MSAESEIAHSLSRLKSAYKDASRGDFTSASVDVVNALQRAARATAAGADINDVAGIFIASQNLLRQISAIAEEGTRSARAVGDAMSYAGNGLASDLFVNVKSNPRHR